MKIIIKEKTPSINHLYGRHSKGFSFIKKEGKEMRQRIIETTKQQAIKQGFKHSDWRDRLLDYKVTIHENWFTKSKPHKTLRKDIANREKYITDSIMQGLNLEDKNIWKHQMIKQDSD